MSRTVTAGELALAAGVGNERSNTYRNKAGTIIPFLEHYSHSTSPDER